MVDPKREAQLIKSSAFPRKRKITKGKIAVSDQQPTFHINIDDYISVLGIQALADAFISAMQKIIDADKEVTVDELLYAF